MILTIDVGNSNIVLTIFDAENVVKKWKIVTDRETTKEEYELIIKQIMASNDFDYKKIDGIVYSSVVPEIDKSLLSGIKFIKAKIIKIKDQTTKLNLKFKENIKDKIGEDILMNLVAAKKKYKENFIAIDMGTATTFSIATKNGEYQGTIIAPGANLSAMALHNHCSLLPEVEIKKPKDFIGNTTKDLMQSGLFYGYIGMIKEIIAKIKEEYKNTKFKICITGGLSVVFVHDLKFIDDYFPYLTAEGLNEVWYLNNK